MGLLSKKRTEANRLSKQGKVYLTVPLNIYHFHFLVSLSGHQSLVSLSVVTLWCHFLVSLSGVNLWCHSDELDKLGKLDELGEFDCLSRALYLYMSLYFGWDR